MDDIHEKEELARLRTEVAILRDKQWFIWFRNRREWFLRAPLFRFLWFLAVGIGSILSIIRALLRYPTYGAKYTPQMLEMQAQKLAKMDDDFDDTFHRIALNTVIINSLLKSEMRDFVSIVPFAQILEKKLRVQRALRYCSKPRPAAVFIIGLPRTGSTLLHQFCGMDPRARAVRAWEFRMPLEASDAPPERFARIQKVQKQLDGFYKLAPAIKAVHYIRSLDPDECVQGFFDCALPDWYLWGAIDAPEAFHWYVNSDMSQQYENYNKFLRVVLEQDEGSVAPSNLWLKTPHHTFKLPELARVFPEAKFVWLHRDPTSSVGSCCSMNEAILDATCPRYVNPHILGERTLQRLSQCVRKGMKDRRELEAQGRIFVDVRYEDLKKNLIGTIRDMYEGLGLNHNLDEGFISALGAFENSKHAQASAHRYRLDHFGLQKDRIRSEFREYINEYLDETTCDFINPTTLSVNST